jgi:hypothetical protein
MVEVAQHRLFDTPADMLSATLRLALTPNAMPCDAGGATQQQQSGLGTARRLAVAQRRQQAALMRDVLCHAPDVILVADIATAEVGMAADSSFVVLCAGIPLWVGAQACTAMIVASNSTWHSC